MTQALRQAQGRGAASEFFRRALRTFKSFSLKASSDGSLSIGIDVDPEQGRADTGSILTDLTDLAVDLGEAARDLGVGTALLVDEMQLLSREELSAVCQACHETSQRRVPFFVLGAGLPNLPGLLAEARSYSERLFQYARIDRLNDDDARAALIRPTEDEGVTWTAEAANAVLEASGGYPYFIQQFGQTTWNVAAASPIDALDAADGLREARAPRSGLLPRPVGSGDSGRTRLSRGNCVNGTGRPRPGSRDAPRTEDDVAGPTRANLIVKGIVYVPE